jgi:hypothetical protein
MNSKMKYSALLLFALLGTLVYSQDLEFTVYPNGLIYSEKTMEKLSQIVDVRNKKFQTCDLNKVFYAKQQVIGHYIKVHSGDVKSAKSDLDKEISFKEFCKKYPSAVIEKNVLLLKHKYKSYDNIELIEIELFDLKDRNGFSIKSEDTSLYRKKVAGTWMYEYNPKSDYSKESIEAFFFPENFKSIQLPQKYVSMVGYADCLIGTETSKLKDEVEEGWVDLPENWISLSEKKKEELLDEMRSTRVIGRCSQDDSPREHAVNIALLSAETNNWEVFIKAHLDILNDSFDRMSDGSYAWNWRKTYIREIEDLNIDVEDLILGISLRIENPENNHYYGSISRIGRALAESKNRKEIEQKMLLIISDTELDLLNRLLIYFLYVNCNYHLTDDAVRRENTERLKTVINTFPEFIRDQLLEN